MAVRPAASRRPAAGLTRRIRPVTIAAVAAVIVAVPAKSRPTAAAGDGPGDRFGAWQAASQAPQFRSTVDLVQVDVVAVDENGHHVRGLTRDDFEIFDRGRPQAIAAFEEVSHAVARAKRALVPDVPADVRLDVASNQTAASERLVVLVVDDLHLYRGRTERTRALASQIVTELGADASMAVLFTSGDRSTEVTGDRARLLAAIAALDGRKAVRRPHQAVDNQRPGRIDPGASMEQALATVSASQRVDMQEFFDNMTKYKTLQDAARLLGTSQIRRKAFVLISEGVDRDLTGVFDGPTTPCEVQGGLCYHDVAMRHMMESMHRQNVTTYAIDPRGEVTSQELMLENFPTPPGVGLTASQDGTGADEESAFRWTNPVRRAQRGLGLLAEASGGFAITDTDDFEAGLTEILADLDHYYLLGFNPPNPEDRGFRRLDVRSKRPGLRLRFRKGYEVGTRRDEASRRTSPLATLVNGVLPEAGVPMRLHAIPMPGRGRDARVAIALELSVPRSQMTSTDQRLLDDVRLGLYAVDLKSAKVREQVGRGARLALRPRPGAGPPPETVTYQIASTLDLPPGRYQLRASATSERLAAGGSVYLSLDVPDFTKEDLALSDLVLGYADGARVPVAWLDGPGGPSGRRGAMPPVAPRVVPFDPTLDRVFATADTLRLYVRPVQKTRRALVATVTTLAPDGTVVLSLERGRPAGADAALDLRLPLQQLPAGPYRLRVQVTDGERTAHREIGFEIR